jgi:DNA polymerase-4
LRDLCGIGKQMEKRLNAYGITSVESLCKADPALLQRAWGGVGGSDMHAKLRGEWADDPRTERSSIGHSHVLAPALRSHRSAYSVLSRLLQKAAMRLRSYGLITGTVHVYVAHLDGSAWEERARLDPTQDTLQLLEALKTLWVRYSRPGAVPMRVGVVLADLREKSGQSRSLFHDIEARNRLNASIDLLNSKYGKNTVYFGGAHQALRSAPMRIAFNHIPNPAVEGD